MREISAEKITDLVEKLCIEANINLNTDIEEALNKALNKENRSIARDVLSQLIENAAIARDENIPICQDTGMAVVFIEIGQDVHISGGDVGEAVNEGVRRGYQKGYLRKSIVRDPVERVNTLDNTPAVIYYEIVPGDSLKITVAPKGFGSENMSAVKMLTPSDGLEGIKEFVLETVRKAGSNPCPPIIVGIGVGGTMDKASLMSKRALLRKISVRSENPFWAEVEEELLGEINAIGIGPAGFGGLTTALNVAIDVYPTHIAGLPVAVNIGCHVTRHSEGII